MNELLNLDHGDLVRLLERGAPRTAEAIGHGGGWHLVVVVDGARCTLVAARGHPRSFGRLETLVAYLREVGIDDVLVRAAGFEPAGSRTGDARARSAAQRLKDTHDDAARGRWMRERAQSELADIRKTLGED